MAGDNRGLHLIRTWSAGPRGAFEKRDSLVDRRAVPHAPVLVLQKDQAPFRSHARPIASPMEADKDEESDDLRLIRQKAGEKSRQPLGVLDKVPAERHSPAGRELAFIK